MNEVEFQGKYSDFKFQMDIEIKEAAEGFVRIGYLLKIARDTNILAESGYQSVAEFAKAEYGLTKDIVSRYIAINDRYAENGYSDRLQERYKAFGVAKLAEMLTLPEEIAEEISPDMTKNQIREIKKDYAEEMKISDLEVLAEEKEDTEMSTLLEKALYEYFKEPEKYKEFQETYYIALSITARSEDIKKVFASKDQMVDVIAPNGIENIRIRVSGIGKLMISINEEDPEITVTNMRTMEKEAYGWDKLGEAFKKLHYYNPDWKEAYKSLYGEYPKEKAEVAPAQQPEKPIKTEAEPVSTQVTEKQKNSENETKKEEKITETVENEPENEEIMPPPVENTPESEQMAAAGEKTEEKIEVVTGEIVENTLYGADRTQEARINMRIGAIEDRMMQIRGAIAAGRWVTAQLAAQDIVNDIGEIIAISMAAGEKKDRQETDVRR